MWPLISARFRRRAETTWLLVIRPIQAAQQHQVMHLSRFDLHRRCRQQPEATKQLAPLELLQQGEELVGFAPEDTLPCRVRLVDDHHIPGLGDGGDRRLF